MMKIVLVVVTLALPLYVSACSSRKVPNPLLAQIENGKIYVPMYPGIPQNPPKNVVFYPVYVDFYANKPVRDHSPLRALFSESRRDIAAGDFSDKRGFFTRTGLVYSPVKQITSERQLGFLDCKDRRHW